GDANDFATFLKTDARKHGYADSKSDDSLSTSTLRKRLQICKQFFADALDHKLIEENPFRRFKTATPANRQKDFFITDAMSEKILAACPNIDWKLIYVLCRYQALRNPSEVLNLKWSDILWDNRQMTVYSPKLAHHENKAYRVQPIFPQTLPFLEAAFDEAPEGAEYIISRYRDQSANLRTQFTKIVRRAGLKIWEKPFINLRASRISELCDQFPTHVVNDWAGHSERVSQLHYRQTLPEHFERAVNATLHVADLSRFCRCEALPSDAEPYFAHEKTPDLQGLAAVGSDQQLHGWSLLDSNQ
ncbi:MAG: site-specific integrase, partial [Planctomycetota bacterium]|nr:site-specific integrase [Planctomycetota bacterium]